MLLDLADDTKVKIQELFDLDKLPSLKESTSELSFFFGGGSVALANDGLRDAYKLLQNEENSADIVKLIGDDDDDVLFLFHQLMYKMIIIKPISYLLSDEEETAGKSLQKQDTIEPPEIWIFFNCNRKIGTIGINWTCGSKEAILATMEINLSTKIDSSWNIVKKEIDEIKKYILSEKLITDKESKMIELEKAITLIYKNPLF